LHGLLQPAHLFFILLIVLILFGPGKLPELGKNFGRSVSELRGEWSSLRSAAFMAKGVDPAIGRDVGDKLPDEHANRAATLYRCLFAILIGNTLYFLLSPALPASARMDAGLSTGLPALVDLWVCLLVFGFLNLWKLVRKSSPGTKR
jgi:TatA/E family protein of Tat protein translocase